MHFRSNPIPNAIDPPSFQRDPNTHRTQIEEYLRGLALPKVVYMHTAFFYENVATKRGTRRVKVRA